MHIISNHWPSHAKLLAKLFLPFDPSDTNVRDGCFHSEFLLFTHNTWRFFRDNWLYESVNTLSMSTLSTFPAGRNLGHIFSGNGSDFFNLYGRVCIRIPFLVMWLSSRVQCAVTVSCDLQSKLAVNANLMCAHRAPLAHWKTMTCNRIVEDKRLMIPLAQANSQVSKPRLYFTSHPEETADPLSVVRVLKCKRNLRKEPNENVLRKCYWNGKKSTWGFHFQE